MKQKSILWSLFILVIMTMMSTGLIACDDKDGGSGKGVVGIWSGRDGKEQLTLTFSSNGSGTYIARYNDSYSGMETETGSFTYTMEGSSKGMIILKYYDSYYGNETEILYFVIEDKTMSLYEDDYYVDLEWVLTKQ